MATPNASTLARRRRLRMAGTVILVGGLTTAWLTDFLQTRGSEPGLEQLMPGSAAADERRMNILYGRGVTMAMGWEDDLHDPAVQAVLIAIVSAIASGLCFHVARVAHDGEEQAPGSVEHRT